MGSQLMSANDREPIGAAGVARKKASGTALPAGFLPALGAQLADKQ